MNFDRDKMKCSDCLRVVFIAFALECLSTQRVSAADPLTIEQFRSEIARIESEWKDYAAEELRFELDTDEKVVRSLSTHTIQIDGRFRQQIIENTDYNSNRSTRMRQWDGKRLLEITPNEKVVMREDAKTEPLSRQPYGVILSELGFSGAMLDFLNLGGSSIKIEFEAMPRSDSPDDFLYRIDRLTDETKHNLIQTITFSGNGEIISGIRRKYSKGSSVAESEVALSSNNFKSDLSISQAIVVSKNVFSPAKTKLGKTSIRVNLEQIKGTRWDDVRIRELTGNPTIQIYRDNSLVSTRQLREPQKTKIETVSVFEQWLVLNNMFLGVGLLGFLLKKLWKRRSTVASTNKTAFSIVPLLVMQVSVGCGRQENELGMSLRNIPETHLERFAPFRLEFEVKGLKGNPYEPSDIDVSIEIETPNGAILTQPAFYKEEYSVVYEHEREIIRESGLACWEVRWSPTEVGQYRWKLLVQQSGRTVSKSGILQCTEGTRRGFVQVSKSDPKYLETSDGAFFFPIGHGTRSPFEDRRENIPFDSLFDSPSVDTAKTRVNDDLPGASKVTKYELWFQKMKDAGENFCTIWMAPWWLELEWSPTREGYGGLGQYNQKHAAQLDAVLNAAERHGITVLLCTTNHGRLSTTIDSEWKSNPHRLKPDGSERTIAEYFESDEVRKLEENRHRYILARWGYSTSLMGLCLCTEANWIDTYRGMQASANSEFRDGSAVTMEQCVRRSQTVVDWFKSLSRYVKRNDIHNHLVTIQFALIGSGSEAWPNTEFEIVMNNGYTKDLVSKELSEKLGHKVRGVADGFLAWEHTLRRTDKPLLMAEWGGSYLANYRQNLETELHTGVWAMSMTEMAGISGFWWAQEIENGDLYNHFTGVSRFWTNYDRRKKGLRSSELSVWVTHSINGTSSTTSSDFFEHPTRNAISLASKTEGFVYVYDHGASSLSITRSNGSEYLIPLERSAWLQLPSELVSGNYQLEFWDTKSGKLISFRKHFVNFNEKSKFIHLPTHRTDLAIKFWRSE